MRSILFFTCLVLALPAAAEDTQPTPLAIACAALATAYPFAEVVSTVAGSDDRQPVEGCVGAGTGAWYIGAEDVADEAIRWSVHYVAADGTTAMLVPPAPANYEWIGLPEGANLDRSTLDQVEIVALSDFDGDGNAEIVLAVRHAVVEDIGDAYVFRATEGRVEPMPLPYTTDFYGARDVDGDGRPDLHFVSPFAVGWSCGDAGPDGLSRPPVVAHALPDGTFSLTDEVAKSVALEACPAAPTALMALSEYEEPFDPWGTVANIACARYWGASADEVVARLQAELAPVTAIAPADDWFCVPSAEQLLALPSAEPPFTLP